MVKKHSSKTMRKQLEGLTDYQLTPREHTELQLQHETLDKVEERIARLSPLQRAECIATYLASEGYKGVSVSSSRKRDAHSELPFDISEITIPVQDIIVATEDILADHDLKRLLNARLVLVKDSTDVIGCRNDNLLEGYVKAFTEKYEKAPTSSIISGVFPNTTNAVVITVKKELTSLDDFIITPHGVQKLGGW